MHCDPCNHPRHKHRIHTKHGVFDRFQSDFQKKKESTNVHMSCCMFLFISIIISACVIEKKGWSRGPEWGWNAKHEFKL